jgi:hypothetical protein
MGQRAARLRQVVDWRAAIVAGVVSVSVFFLTNLLLSTITLGSPWIILRLQAAVLLGEQALPPPAGFTWPVFLIGLLVNFLVGIPYACLIALMLHRWGLLVGVLGGALLGAAFYLITTFSLSYFFPWFYALRSWMMLWSSVLFGAVAGGVYELLEVEKFVPDNG